MKKWSFWVAPDKSGGFPEPFQKQSETFHNRWQLERLSRVINQDLRDLESVKEISLVELLANALPARVGSMLSLKSLSEDLQVSPHTIDRWIGIFDNLYYSFRISPFGSEKMKAVKKAQKLYLWDWSQIEDDGARFENLVASHLLKFCHFQEDTLGIKTELRYFRNIVTEKEIDFVVLQKNKPLYAVECKTGDREISKALLSDGKRLKIPKLYQVHMKDKDYGRSDSVRVLPFSKFCELENIP
jgi:predicted AAA+ superfamily ATPase